MFEGRLQPTPDVLLLGFLLEQLLFDCLEVLLTADQEFEITVTLIHFQLFPGAYLLESGLIELELVFSLNAKLL